MVFWKAYDEDETLTKGTMQLFVITCYGETILPHTVKSKSPSSLRSSIIKKNDYISKHLQECNSESGELYLPADKMLCLYSRQKFVFAFRN